MTSKVKGTEGIEFPDSTVQGSAAYTKAESDAQEPFIGFSGTFAGSGIATIGSIPFTVDRNDGGFFNGTRFQPNVAGWYSVSCSGEFSITALAFAGIDIKKSGSAIRRQVQGPYNGTGVNACVSAEVYLNGTTDYIEFWYAASPTGGTLAANTFCSGALIRKGT